MSRFIPTRGRHAAFRLIAATFAVLSMCVPNVTGAQVASDSDTLVYHQITDLGDATQSISGSPRATVVIAYPAFPSSRCHSLTTATSSELRRLIR